MAYRMIQIGLGAMGGEWCETALPPNIKDGLIGSRCRGRYQSRGIEGSAGLPRLARRPVLHRPPESAKREPGGFLHDCSDTCPSRGSRRPGIGSRFTYSFRKADRGYAGGVRPHRGTK